MTITQALEILRVAPRDNEPFSVLLACSFTPLHLQTLLAAHVQSRMPAKRAVIAAGDYGDLAGTLERATQQSLDALVVALEWQDLDARFSYREAGAWGRALESDLLNGIRPRLDRLEAAIQSASANVPAAVCLPTLPLAPAFHNPSWQAGETELFLHEQVFAFGRRLAQQKNVRLLNPSWISGTTPIGNRLDLKSELLVGLPYTVSHADLLADAFARLLAPAPPLKGIITDLDDTFWSGIVGEIGPEAVRWEAASRYHLHGLYQKMLAALADDGVLVGIASKNDASVVREALKRSDLLIPAAKIFPVEVHWAPKSKSVSRILKTWNISADAVAFVDDTPLELAEVANTHPGITCVRFPAGDYKGVLELVKQLRDLCGKGQLTEEDTLRLESIRGGVAFQEQGEHSNSPETFLSQINSKLTFDFDTPSSSTRALELINKTNQFNLNGLRLTQAEWEKRLSRRGSFLASIKYEDKFGPLGTISVIQGYKDRDTLEVETWVMSCRAFSRRIEHQCMKMLFQRFDVANLSFHFVPTAKNATLREYFGSILGSVPDKGFKVTQNQFFACCPALYHGVEQTEGVALNG